MKNAVYCIARDKDQAEMIVDRLRTAGFASSDISVLMPDKSGTRDFAHEQNTKMPEGATTGGVAGMGVGAALGWLAGIGSLAIPGVGPFIAAGPIMAALGGAAVGGATGGVIGGLVGMGIPEYEAKLYDGKIRGGNALITVHTDNSDEVTAVKDIYKRSGAEDIKSSSESSVPSGSDDDASRSKSKSRFGSDSSLGNDIDDTSPHISPAAREERRSGTSTLGYRSEERRHANRV